MVEIEKITNGYIVKFKNPNNITMKLFFPTFESLSEWLRSQFEPPKKEGV